jgi:pantoate--beta-alanine ligase
MRIVERVRTMHQLASRCRKAGRKIGLVPTMGCLHAGHLSLVHRARRLVGAQGRIVLSIFVNPTQFGPHEDFTRYPRDLARDARLCRQAGVDLVFAPTVADMYPGTPDRSFSTWVLEESLSKCMEGASRPTHFRGVTTVVAKLFNIVAPDVAVFGQKDFQQAAIIQRMVRDLNFPVKVVVAPTTREADGLAMSSRNQYLSPADRSQAVVLWEAIRLARRLVRISRKPLPAEKVQEQITKLIGQCPAARIDYVALFDPRTLTPADVVVPGTQLALAVFVGQTRLIDNSRV